MLELFQATYQVPGQPVVTERGLTREGADKLQSLVLKAGGWGNCMPIQGGLAAMGPQSKPALPLQWVREPQAGGSVRWHLYRGLKRTRWFVERPASIYDRYDRRLPYVLCCMSMQRKGPTSDEGAFKTLALAKLEAEQSATLAA
jgi:hypothetical protein